MKAYLDVDGVILTKDGIQMPNLKEFLDILFTVFEGEIYWLTTHCKDSDTSRVLNRLQGVLEHDQYERLLFIKPAPWYELKTEGIDFNDRFYWFDDNVFLAEQKVLEDHGKKDSWIKVDNNLIEIVDYLEREFPQYHRNRGKYWRTINGVLI
jgi:hypothetical protein